jgi:hypothetical protein
MNQRNTNLIPYIAITVVALFAVISLFATLQKSRMAPDNLLDKSGTHTVVVYKDQPVPYYYLTAKDSITGGDLWIPIMSAPEDLEKFIDKTVNVEGEFIADDGYATVCRPQYIDECKKQTPFGNSELHINKIELAQ